MTTPKISFQLIVTAVFCLLSATPSESSFLGNGIGLFDNIVHIYGRGREIVSRRGQLTLAHPETFLPAVTRLNNLTPVNISIVTETRCRFPHGTYYRSIDGTCAHPRNLGAATKQIARILPPRYEDGFEAPVEYSVTGRRLPNPREVSKNIHTDEDVASDFTIMLMQWGQLMDHDMVSTPLPIEDTRSVITCCGPNKTLPLGDEDPECFPILFEEDDNFHGQCMEFVRSQPMTDSSGNRVLPRQHMNAVTSFVDASTVYGSSEEVMKELRTRHGRGYLFRLDRGRPVDNGRDDCFKREGRNDVCFLAGDERINEQPGLAAIHTIFMRQHNKWARRLRRLNPWMPAEVVFQRIRAIVIAVTQKIMYNDWLPAILGTEVATAEGIFSPINFRSRFDASFDPSIFHAFATAVFRFGHTLIPKRFDLGTGQRDNLRDLFFKPYLVFENFEDICINLVTGTEPEDRSQDFDRHITEEVTNHLFENEEGIMRGFDLVTLNLQRGRDHGIPSYNDYRELCGLHRVRYWNDSALGDAGAIFETIYDHPDDIELFSGGLSEPKHKDGIVGETFSCLMVRQFRNLKFGDRYFFNHYNNSKRHGFGRNQLKEIHRYTISHLMCATTKMKEIQVDALRKPGPNNPIVPCECLLRSSIRIEKFAYMWGF